MNTHPQPEELVAYQEGRLAEDDAARVRRHLLVCPECAEELDQLGRFDQEPAADDELLPTPAETADDWAAFQQLLRAEEAAPGTSTTTARPTLSEMAPAREQRPWWGARRPLLLAASVALVAAGLGFWLATLAGRPAPVADPATLGENPWLVALLPDGENRVRAAAGGRKIEPPADVDLLILRLHLGDQTPYPAYRVEILEADGATIPVRPRLRRQSAGHFLALIDRAALPTGRYRLELLAVSDGEERPLATYSFELREPQRE